MKKILVLTLVMVSMATNSMDAQEINWVTLEEAIELQKKQPKKIMMDVYTNWCGPCKLLDKNTFQNKDVADYVNEHYYAVKFNAEGKDEVKFNGKVFANPNYDLALANRRNSVHELSRYLQVQAYPTIVFLDEEAQLIAPIKGYKKPAELELYLKMFKSNKHKEIDTQEKFYKYYEAFKPEFKG